MNTQFYNQFHVCRIAVDSRHVVPHSLFVALKGQKADGHDFLAEAYARGAIAAVVRKDCDANIPGLTLLKVEDPLETLQNWAAETLSRMGCQVVAVTGSVGKTTTKQFIAALLKQRFKVAATAGNANSQIGLPLSILNDFKGDEQIVVLEMAMTLPGQISRLVEIAPPDIAVITAVELVHAQFFESLQQIGQAKGEILLHPHTRCGILSADIINLEELKQWGDCRKVTFSTRRPADYELKDRKDEIEIEEYGFLHSLPQLVVEGRHNCHNALAAIVVARKLGLSWEEIKAGMASFTLPEQRFQRQEVGGIVFINDAYNACEVSIKAALDSLPSSGGRKIAVLGSMLELGGYSAACHAAVGAYALDKVDALFCLGEECRPMVRCWEMAGREAALFIDRSSLVDALKSAAAPNDVVLLKGSRAKELWKVIQEVVN